MNIYSIEDEVFRPYGRVIRGYDTEALLEELRETTACPQNGVVYEPSVPKFEALPIFEMLQNGVYGGMPIQIGYCNGNNHTLNGLEYHRGSEINISESGCVLLLARMEEIDDEGQLYTDCVKAFKMPAGAAVLIYETTLHYAPCTLPGRECFRNIVVLPRGTNTVKPALVGIEDENKRLFGKNKWLLVHPESPEAGKGAYIGLKGKNITI